MMTNSVPGGKSRVKVRSQQFSRRHFLSFIGSGSTIVLSGCTSTNDEPQYTRADVNNTTGKPRTANEMVAAEAVARSKDIVCGSRRCKALA